MVIFLNKEIRNLMLQLLSKSSKRINSIQELKKIKTGNKIEINS